MSLTICLINFALLILPAALNFNIVQAVEEETPRAFALHPRLVEQQMAVEKVEDVAAAGGRDNHDEEPESSRVLIPSSPRAGSNSQASEGEGPPLRLWRERKQANEQENLNVSRTTCLCR